MNTIRMQKTFYKIGDFLSWQDAGTLDLSPDFQRRSVWKVGAKSYLIDTIVRGFPIPIIFLRDKLTDLSTFEPKREVIDGQQRLRTIIAYVKPSLLPDFDPNRDGFTVKRVHNDMLAGKRFDQLSPDAQRQILDYQFSVHILSSSVDDRTILQIFRRMNSTNYNLKPQELRNAEWFGEFKTSAYDLAAEHLDYWRKWGTFTEDGIARMQEVELTSDLCNFIINGISAGNKPQIDKIYRQKDENYPERSIVEERFRIVMSTINQKLGTDMRHSILGKQALLYVLFVWFYTKLYGNDDIFNKNIEVSNVSPDEIAELKLRVGRLEDNDTNNWLRRPKALPIREEMVRYFGIEVS